MRKTSTQLDARRPAKLFLYVPGVHFESTTGQDAGQHAPLRSMWLATKALVVSLALLPSVSAAPPVVVDPPSDKAVPAPEPPEQAGEPGIVIVEGQITDHVGAGQKGVKVTVHRKTKEGDAGDEIATTVTNEVGDFTITVPEPFRGDVIVAFSKPLYADLSREVHIGDDEYPPYLAETLAGKLVVIGLVSNALDGTPVADASVTLEAQYMDWQEKTDDKGRFTIKGVFPGRGVLIVEAEGYGRQRQPVASLEDFGEIVVQLKPERIVHVKTVDDSGSPISGVTIECYDEQRNDFRTIVTGDNGAATFRGIHFDADELSLRLTHEDFVSSEGFDHWIITPPDKAESSHELVMVRAGRIEGRVTEATTGQPLNGARVITGNEHSDSSPRDWADYQGDYAITGVTPGRTTVTVHSSGYAPDLKTVEVTAGQTITLDFSLTVGVVLTGLVKDSDGKPVSPAFVDATRWRGRSTLGLRAVTDENGEFTIADAPRDEFEIVAGAPDHGQVMRTVQAGSSQKIEIILSSAPKPGAPRNHLGTNVGDPVPDVTVTTLDGRTLSLRKLAGKTILLDFWATWCHPCIEEMPQLIAVYKKYGSREDFVMIGISRDFDKAVLTRFLGRNPEIKWHQVIGEDGGVETARQKLGVAAVPRVFLIGSDGKIVANRLRDDEIFKRVQEVMEGEDTR